MEFEEPVLALRYGGGNERSEEARGQLRERRLVSVALPTVEDLLRVYPDFGSASCVFVSGSVTQGWGHANSDLDLFVVSRDAITVSDVSVELFEERVSTTDPTVWLAIGEVGQFRADIELWREEQVDELIGRFAGSAPGQEGAELGRTEKELLYRISVGKPLMGEQQFSSWRDAIRTSTFGIWLAENRKLSAEGMLEDVSGMLQSGDSESAALAAREAFVGGLEALLAVYGDYSSSRKWLYRRLVAANPTEVSVADGWAALTMAGAAEDPAGWARRTAALAQRLLVAIERRSL